MADSPMAKASIDGMRSLSVRELATIRAGLSIVLWAGSDVLENAGAYLAADNEIILSNDEIEALLSELSTCRKVSVCRSNASRT